MRRFLRHFLKVNKVQLMILPVVLILAVLSGAIYFNFDKIVSSNAEVSVKGTKIPKEEATEKKETPASSPQTKAEQREKKSKSTTLTKDEKTSSSPQFSQSPQEGQSLSQNQQETITAELSIDHGGRKTYFVEVAKGSTVYDLLKKASHQYGFSLGASNYAYGVFIEEIDGIRNNPQEGKYWLYYLNGKFANVGASSQKLSPGDKVLWRYEESR